MFDFLLNHKPLKHLTIDTENFSLNNFTFDTQEKEITRLFPPDKKIKYGQDTEFLYFNSGLCLSFSHGKLESFMIFTAKSTRSDAYRKMKYNPLTIIHKKQKNILTDLTTKETIIQIMGSPFESYISDNDYCETFLYIYKEHHIICKFTVDGHLTIFEYCTP